MRGRHILFGQLVESASVIMIKYRFGIYPIVRLIWNFLRNVLRLRHRIKVFFFSFWSVEQSVLCIILPSSDILQYGGNDSLYLEKAVLYNSRGKGYIDSFAHIYEANKPFVCKLKNVHLVGDFAAPLTKNRRIITENLFGVRHTALRLKPTQLLRYSFTKKDYKFDEIFVINSPYCHNYYHWFTDCLTSLEAYEVYKQHVNANCELVIPEYLFQWQKRSLNLLGYNDGSYTKWKYQHARASILVLGSTRKFAYGNNDDPLSPSSLKWLRNRLLKSKRTRNSEIKFSRRVFISRKDSQKDVRINNENQVSAFLYQYGFCTYQLRELSLDEQINLFSGAEIIVSTHGAGLTNLIFSDASYIIEIFPEGNLRKDFYAIATIIGSNYIAINASACPKGEGFYVDVKCLEEILEDCKI